MNLGEQTIQNLGKVVRTGDLAKLPPTSQSDNLSDRAALAIQTIMQVVVEHPHDATLQSMIVRFRTALDSYSTGISTSPSEAARVFGIEIDRIIREVEAGKALRSSLQKGRSFLDRDRLSP